LHVASSRAPVVERDDLTAPVCLAALPDVDNGNGRQLLDRQQACLNVVQRLPHSPSVVGKNNSHEFWFGRRNLRE